MGRYIVEFTESEIMEIANPGKESEKSQTGLLWRGLI